MSERRWSGPHHGPNRATVVALLLACVTVITLDARSTSPLEPVRRAVGDVYGPAESSAATAARPFTSVPDWFRRQSSMREDIAALQAKNSRLESQARVSGYQKNKLAEYEGLTATAEKIGYELVPAHVVGLGSSQSFSRTATIDAGSDAGIEPDMTVVSADGLVGRVLRVTRTTATVLLIVDADSTVGGRVASSMQVGFVHGSGSLSRTGRLDLELVDQSVVPRKGDTVLTWGSDRGAPYVSGVPIGTVTSVYTSLRDSTQRAVVEPFVDFGALDVVGVVVPSGTTSDRGVIDADGSLR